jgi:hypothetical protein
MIEVKREQESKAETDTIGFDWLRRQREAFEVSSRSVRKVYDSRNIIDVAQAQNEWVSDCLEWTASHIRAVGKDAATLTRKAAQRLGEAARERGSALRQQSEALSHPAAPAPMERAAAE